MDHGEVNANPVKFERRIFLRNITIPVRAFAFLRHSIIIDVAIKCRNK